jgi:hypothetical protein
MAANNISLVASGRSYGSACWRAFFIGLASLALAAFAGCSLTPTDVWVYIDNSGTKPLTVEVDGHLAAKIKPGEVAKVSYPAGEHHFHLTSGDEVVCHVTKNLEQSDRMCACRKYLFNPDKNNRYQTYQAKYGTSRLEGVMQTSLLKYQKDPQIKRQYVYKQLLKEIKLLPDDAWNDVTTIDYVLTPPPDSVVSDGTARRSVLARIDPKLYTRLERMAKIEKPTDDDIDTLDELIDQILSEAP